MYCMRKHGLQGRLPLTAVSNPVEGEGSNRQTRRGKCGRGAWRGKMPASGSAGSSAQAEAQFGKGRKLTLHLLGKGKQSMPRSCSLASCPPCSCRCCYANVSPALAAKSSGPQERALPELCRPAERARGRTNVLPAALPALHCRYWGSIWCLLRRLPEREGAQFWLTKPMRCGQLGVRPGPRRRAAAPGNRLGREPASPRPVWLRPPDSDLVD